ncbi:MAG TPA: hypothetical protein VG603_01230, partial [Chitinophagales bacterium]|nr:hypothetical protein [Chitinophagales bacterium]
MNKYLRLIGLYMVMVVVLLSCKKEHGNSIAGHWVKSPVSPGGQVNLDIPDGSHFQLGYTVGIVYYETVSGTYTSNGSQVAFTNLSGPSPYCAGLPGTYTYTVSDNRLVLTVVDDSCIDTSGAKR